MCASTFSTADQRPNYGTGLEPVGDLHRPGGLGEALGESVIHAILHRDALSRYGMALIENAKDRRADQSPSGYSRLFGVPGLGSLISRIQAAVISSGRELEQPIWD
jgi:hypothetical protein